MTEGSGDVTEAGDDCPLAETDDKVDEAHFFLHKTLEAYHDPAPLRFFLNAFLQSLRSITLYLQGEMKSIDGFEEWYAPRRQAMRDDVLLVRFLEGRNAVAHRRSLEAASTVEAGVFRGRTPKLALGIPISPRRSSASVIEFFQAEGRWIDPEHLFIGEQLGVRRVWKVPELAPEEEVTSMCHVAWSRIQRVVSDAHVLLGRSMKAVPEEPSDAHDYRSYNVLLESDLDPRGPERWGWTP